VYRTPGVDKKYEYLSLEKNMQIRNGPTTSLMGPGGAVWGKNRFKKSSETVLLNLTDESFRLMATFISKIAKRHSYLHVF